MDHRKKLSHFPKWKTNQSHIYRNNKSCTLSPPNDNVLFFDNVLTRSQKDKMIKERYWWWMFDSKIRDKEIVVGKLMIVKSLRVGGLPTTTHPIQLKAKHEFAKPGASFYLANIQSENKAIKCNRSMWTKECWW